VFVDTLQFLLATVFVHNIVLTQFLGLCPFIGISHHAGAASGMAIATTLILTLTAGLAYPLYWHVLVPLELVELYTLALIFLIASLVQALEILIRISSELLAQRLGVYLPLITSNCAVLGVGLLVVQQELTSWWQSIVFGLGAGLGFSLALIVMAQLRQRLQFAKVAPCLQNIPIGLITAGIASLGLLGLKF